MALYEADAKAQSVSENLFAKLDSNDSGTLDLQELTRARNVLLSGPQIDVSVTSALYGMFDGADENKDGGVDLAEWTEFSRSIYEVTGRKVFHAVTSNWMADLAENSLAATVPCESETEDTMLHCDSHASAPSSRKGSKLKKKSQGVQEKAATKIQAVQRGKKARKTAASKRACLVQRGGEATVLPLTTVWELWELLTATGGASHTTLVVADLEVLFEKCKNTGINTVLVQAVPMSWEPDDDDKPTNLTPKEVVHLCTLAIQDPRLTEEEARVQIAAVHGSTSPTASERLTSLQESGLEGERQATINLRIFKRIIGLIAVMMRIDEIYLVTHMAWCQTSHFEMPDDLFRLLRQCSSKRTRSTNIGEVSNKLCAVVNIEEDGFAPLALAPSAEETTSGETFTLLNFNYLCYNTDLVHDDGSSGLTYEEMSSHFERVTKNMSTLLERYELKQKLMSMRQLTGSRSLSEKPDRPLLPALKTLHLHSANLSGRTELSVLFEELAAAPRIKAEFSSPLEMIASLLQRANQLAS